MHRLQQVVHGLYGVECLDGHLDEDGDPVGHGAVPEAGQLQCLQFAAILRLIGDEACVGVHIVSQAEGLAFVVPAAANQINGIEMGRALEDRLLLCVFVVDLRGLDDL